MNRRPAGPTFPVRGCAFTLQDNLLDCLHRGLQTGHFKQARQREFRRTELRFTVTYEQTFLAKLVGEAANRLRDAVIQMAL